MLLTSTILTLAKKDILNTIKYKHDNHRITIKVILTSKFQETQKEGIINELSMHRETFQDGLTSKTKEFQTKLVFSYQSRKGNESLIRAGFL